MTVAASLTDCWHKSCAVSSTVQFCLIAFYLEEEEKTLV